MTTLHTLPKSTARRARRGRGIAAGQGKTGGRGTKGQKARAGYNIPAGFEGGQTKLYLRLPKRRGEANRPRPGKATVTLGLLDRHFANGERVTLRSLRTKGLIDQAATRVKIVGTGTLTKTLKFAGVSFTGSVYTQLFGEKLTADKSKRHSELDSESGSRFRQS